MDLGTIVGLVIAWALVIWSLVIGAGIAPYIDFPSFLITVGGSIGVVIYTTIRAESYFSACRFCC